MRRRFLSQRWRVNVIRHHWLMATDSSCQDVVIPYCKKQGGAGSWGLDHPSYNLDLSPPSTHTGAGEPSGYPCRFPPVQALWGWTGLGSQIPTRMQGYSGYGSMRPFRLQIQSTTAVRNVTSVCICVCITGPLITRHYRELRGIWIELIRHIYSFRPQISYTIILSSYFVGRSCRRIS